MNIWYLSAHDYPGGHSSRTFDFSRELVRLGHSVTMFTNSYCHRGHTEKLKESETWRIEYIDGVRVIWLRTAHYKDNGYKRGLNMLTNMIRSFQVAKTLSDKPDVVIGPSVPLGTGWIAFKIAQAKKASFVFEVRDVWPMALVFNRALSRYSPVYFLFRYLEKKLYRESQRISSTLPFISEHVSKSGGCSDSVVYIPNGVNAEKFTHLDKYDRGGDQRLVAMYVGGFGVAHDVITIVRAANILQQQGFSNYQFVIVGDGVKRSECQCEAKLYKLKNIEFRNAIPKSDIPRLLSAADVLIACITKSNTYKFGINLNKIYDYLASGKMVVLSGNAPNDPIKESGAGFSVPPENPAALAAALLQIQKMSQSERIAMGEKGRTFVVNGFDMSVLALRMERVLSEAIEEKRRMNAS